MQRRGEGGCGVAAKSGGRGGVKETKMQELVLRNTRSHESPTYACKGHMLLMLSRIGGACAHEIDVAETSVTRVVVAAGFRGPNAPATPVNDHDGGGAGGGDDDWRNNKPLGARIRGGARGERKHDGISGTQHERVKDGGDGDGDFEVGALVCGLDLANR